MGAPIEEKREISIRGTSPLRHPERITTKDTEIVRSVRSRMMEKEAERKHGNSEERGFASEYGTERDKSIEGRPQGSERRYEKDDRYQGRQPEQERRTSHYSSSRIDKSYGPFNLYWGNSFC